jgi:hypothetical protein
MRPAEAGGCAVLAAAADEPLPGSASRLRHWLLVEQPGRWGHDALVDSGMPLEIGTALGEASDRLGVRVLLIKRRGRPLTGPRRVYAAFTGRRERRLNALDLEDPAGLMDLDLERLMDRRWAGLGEPIPGPLFVVCTHGKHDACCAREGAPLARALDDRRDVWECTHVGGDRFAGNLVAFPHGLYFGRAGPDDGPRIADAYEAGRIALDLYRGRSAYHPAAQAAESFLRVELGLDGVDDLVLQAQDRRPGGRHRVAFLVPGGATRSVEVREVLMEERFLTCKATHPHRPRRFVLERLH